MDLYEAIYSLRAMRRLKTDPVPEEMIWKVLDAAIRAPSGGNRQPWNFIVVTDLEKKRKIAEWYLDGWEKMYGAAGGAMEGDNDLARTLRSADHLARNLAEVPVFVIPTVRVEGTAAVSGTGSSIFPAVQNLMLAARAEGLGTTLTTLHKTHEAEVKELLGIPDGVETMCLIPMGWPKGKFGGGPRMPVEQVTYWEGWGETRGK
ncbi:MAG TPA: nitroreductase family protein [Dehalococcoidia bacterium]|nr:nitroreductase family protein [Dehalococcoidia bacterium]